MKPTAMLESNYVTHVFIAELPKKPGYYTKLSYFMKNYYEDAAYSRKNDPHTIYTQKQIDEHLVNKEIKVLKKNLVEVSHATDLYLGFDGYIYKGPSQHADFQMERIEKM